MKHPKVVVVGAVLCRYVLSRVCVCVCVCACVRACVRACVCVCKVLAVVDSCTAIHFYVQIKMCRWLISLNRA